MGSEAPQRYDPNLSPPELRPEPPQVFVRTFVTPPAAPWVQTRAANLEAKHGAPLPVADLMHRLKRLEGWFPGRAARFAVFYIRRSDYRSPFETIVDVDGDAVRVAFGSSRRDFRQFRTVAIASVVAVLSVLLAGGAVAVALEARNDADEKVDSVAHQAASRVRQGERLQAQADVVRALAKAKGKSGSPAEVLEDLEWLVHSKTANAQILAVHWDHGLLAIEARGDTAPLEAVDREIVRSPHPIRPGVWLWGVQRPSTTVAATSNFKP